MGSPQKLFCGVIKNRRNFSAVFLFVDNLGFRFFGFFSFAFGGDNSLRETVITDVLFCF